VSGALLVLGPDQDGAYSAAAVWPDISRDMQYLGKAAEKALKERKGIVEQVLRDRRGTARSPQAKPITIERRKNGLASSTIPRSAFVGYPIEVSGELHGAVILDITNPSDEELQHALRMLHWGSAWLIDKYRQQTLEDKQAHLGRLSIASDLVATALKEQRFGASALATANELAARMQCDRVSIGFESSGSVEVKAISNTAKFDRKTNLVRNISDAMDEVLDLDTEIVFPVQGEDELGLLAHGELAEEHKDIAICSVPLIEDAHVIGVITLERTQGSVFDPEDVNVCKTSGLLLGPVLWLKLQNERSWVMRLRESMRNGSEALFGPRHPGVKLIALVLIALILFFSVFEMEYRVSADASLEGSVQRAATAPFDGYISESTVRAGDTVSKGQVLCRLDDKDLQLDRVRWASEREQSERRFRQALAVRDRPAMIIAQAQTNQAQAQLTLAEDKLARAVLKAPFDGVVVSGDLSQLLGSPVEQGKVLFEIAPLDSYRVILKVDERDISQINVGQTGSLALSGIPYQVMHFAVKQITPVSTSADGKNYFRVEAEIEDPSERLRPGMEGVGKVEVGEQKLIWIFTHRLVDWYRLWAWEWMP
jgi:RND family efflux transporter MFP subunit